MYSYFCDKLGINFPIIQAPMAGVSTLKLAVSVSNAGGLGSLGIGANDIDESRKLILEAKSLTDKPLNINVFCHDKAIHNYQVENEWIEALSPLFERFGSNTPNSLNEIYKSYNDNDDLFELLLELTPKVVSFHFGLPKASHIAAFKEKNIITLANATNINEALKAEELGADFIIAQGIEAGGHRGAFNENAKDDNLQAIELLNILKDIVKIPIIAAGGIMNGYDAQEFINNGACAVQMGTAFILCPESSANHHYRELLKSERAKNTKLTNIISGRPARGIINEFIEYFESLSLEVPKYPLAYDIAKQLNNAAISNNCFEFGANWAGSNAYKCREMEASKLVQIIAKEMKLL